MVCEQIGKPSTTYKWVKGDGTGTCAKHLRIHHGIFPSEKGGPSTSNEIQTTIGNYAESGGGLPFSYNRDKMIDNMATYITSAELPFSHAENPYFEEFAQLSLNPHYTKVSRHTIKRRAKEQYYKQRQKLINFFAEFDGRVALTSDCWTSSQGESYLCITVHWLDAKFLIQKRIIAFDIMQGRHSGLNIYSRIKETLKEFNLNNKLFSISFDNASSNTKCIDHMKKSNELNLVLEGKLLHVRCAAHIINLSVQKGIEFMLPLLEPIRNTIKWLRYRIDVKEQFQKMAAEQGLKTNKRFCLDTPTRWNSTHKMLNDAIRYKNIITELYNSCHLNDDFDNHIQETDWEIAIGINELLATYENATKIFSLIYEPNIHLVILECIKIVLKASKCTEIDPALTPIWDDMKSKWLTYFQEFPLLYGVACILDPCVKTEGLINGLGISLPGPAPSPPRPRRFPPVNIPSLRPQTSLFSPVLVPFTWTMVSSSYGLLAIVVTAYVPDLFLGAFFKLAIGFLGFERGNGFLNY